MTNASQCRYREKATEKKEKMLWDTDKENSEQEHSRVHTTNSKNMNIMRFLRNYGVLLHETSLARLDVTS
jgi:hypothetical protein